MLIIWLIRGFSGDWLKAEYIVTRFRETVEFFDQPRTDLYMVSRIYDGRAAILAAKLGVNSE